MSTKVEKLAEEGDPEAQCSLAFLFEIGLDRDVDLDQALSWWRKAADQGHPIALEKVSAITGEPMPEQPASNPKQSHTRDGVEVRTKVLLIEDEDDLRALLEAELEENGFHVMAAVDGQEGLNKLIATPGVHLIITDLKMPRMNGIQFIKTLRKMRIAETAGLIVMTSYSKPELIETGRKMKVDHWLAKPFDLTKIVETVNQVLKKRQRVA
ncbi:response regulator [Pseudobacteriovorax antillogorgiicola]|uniref:Response regulator receiver domain-containing protein n=1 Tax=Pseudobacteriovorax antillogorgiicola TaxID=1513793 RepID=A0A1Y6CA44_9BACT|nr:response regulator [Pseudobacteriovorax antillogorgiicola]TCS51815.1 response regulator receiver domain-containing protein [Pseudobacteriovorax antillogorgiicola]SMF50220.1 Response regulator receiver domain-containing protein [Pseudobacteriovorax antillogorgiicola]